LGGPGRPIGTDISLKGENPNGEGLVERMVLPLRRDRNTPPKRKESEKTQQGERGAIGPRGIFGVHLGREKTKGQESKTKKKGRGRGKKKYIPKEREPEKQIHRKPIAKPKVKPKFIVETGKLQT